MVVITVEDSKHESVGFRDATKGIDERLEL
jgi:hypothetical protein